MQKFLEGKTIMALRARIRFSSVLIALLFLSSCGQQDTLTNPRDPESAAGNRVTLQVQKAGAGDGTVTSSPKGINCGSQCDKSFPVGTVVTLTATPSLGSVFTGWSGGECSGTGPCVTTLQSNTTVTAVFDVAGGGERFILTVNKAITGLGDGTVTSSPEGIDCGSTCVNSFPAGTSITLFASADAGEFTGWSEGPCAGSTDPTCTFTLNANTTATADFATQPLTITTTELPDGNLGAEYTAFISSSGGFGSPDEFKIIEGSLPRGLKMERSFGVQSTVIHGVPTEVGTFTFTVEVEDDSGTDTQELSITISTAEPLVITLPGPTANPGTVGEFYFQNLFASGGQPPYEWSITGGQLPPGLELVSAQNGNRIEGTPTTAGTFTFTLTVSDQLGQQTSQETSITIN